MTSRVIIILSDNPCFHKFEKHWSPFVIDTALFSFSWYLGVPNN